MIIAPSILAANFAKLEEQIKLAEKAGADWFHLDVMDGHFVPNISFGPMMVKTMRRITGLPLDVHLMIETPDLYIKQFVDAGADHILVHVEAATHLNRTLNLIQELGAVAGVAINPATPCSFLEPVLDDIQLVCAMSVNPGFGGQSFIESSIKKIEKICQLLNSTTHEIKLEVDGGITAANAGRVLHAGVDILVAGSAIFGGKDIAKNIKALRLADSSLV